MAERKEWWEILRDQFASRGLLDPESERIQEAVSAAPAVKRQARGLLSLDPQAESDAVLEMGLGSLPGTGQLMALRDLERARRAKDPGAAAMAASNFIPFGTLLNRFRRGPMSELDVYHGTPHRFPGTEANPLGEFDASKIGTGEGAQAYGHGIYLAQKPEVAQDYQFMLSKIDPETVTYQGKPAQHWYDTAQAEQDRAHRLRDKTAIDRANAKLAYWENVMTRRHPEDVKRVANDPDDGWKTFADYANSLDMNKFGGVGEAGSLYKADLPDEMIDRMLEWDKPLSEQAPNIQKAVSRYIIEMEPHLPSNSRMKYLALNQRVRDADITGAELYKNAQELLGSQLPAALLKKQGIPGIKYLDEGSRGASGTGRWKIKPKEGAERIYDFKPNEDVLQLMGATAEPVGTRNFVVFPGEEKKVKILERK
jgi:hypothetical protein